MILKRFFSDMRMSHYVPQTDIKSLKNWEFLGREWIGEAVGFSEWLYSPDAPSMLEIMGIDISAFPGVESLLLKLEIVFPALNKVGVGILLGSPSASKVWPSGRQTLLYWHPDREPYAIECAFDGEDLVFITIIKSPWWSGSGWPWE